MAGTKKKTGLGVEALFRPTPSQPDHTLERESPGVQPAPEPEPAPLVSTEPAGQRPKSDKMRTTIMLNPDTLAGMDLYKVRLKRYRKKPSYSEIIDEAVRLFLKVHDGDHQP